MYADNQVDLLGDGLTKYEHEHGERCNASAILSYGLSGSALAGEGMEGVEVAMTREVQAGMIAAADAAATGGYVGAILGGVFLLGLAVVIVASCSG
jgi:hypothetical protein